MKKDSCETCRFSTKIEAGKGSLGGFVCRRHPPTPIMVLVQMPPSLANPQGMAQPALQGYHPPVAPDQWCGEYQLSIVNQSVN